MPLCFDEHEHNVSPVIDQPHFLFPPEGRPDMIQAQVRECTDSLHSEAYSVPEVAAETPVEQTVSEDGASAVSGTPVERLYTYMSADFTTLDKDQNGSLDSKELEASLSSRTNTDELQILSWMSKNLNALEHLGDRESGLSMNDLAGLNTAINKGSGDIGLAFRNTDWFARGASSAVGGMGGTFAMAKIEKTAFSMKGALGLTAAVFGGLTAIDAIGYYMFDKPKLDKALAELNELPTR
ncbi:MAG: hypothetical protein K2Y39_23895 [Candidatus Obscuribacterales bacterium]|nr:hypothetical protein [Candidatus Obscuribacterales bacterium]